MPLTQLTKNERYQITHLHLAGFTHAQIARRIGRHRATVGRELARNVEDFGGYHYESADRIACERREHANQRYKLDDAILGDRVREGLGRRWSPEQIAGRLRREHSGDPRMYVSPEAIYQWIYREHRRGHHWYVHLRRRRPRRRRRIPGERRANRGQIPGRIGIEKRSIVIDRRQRFGDWESDTIEGRKGSGLIVTHVERKSRYVRLGLLENKRAATLTKVSTTVLADLPAKLRRTMTADNGKEFAAFAELKRRLGVKFYFADPHAPWQRGTNENSNGLLRDYFPKGSDFARLTRRELAHAQTMLNNRPRKCLNYRTPVEVLNRLPGVALRN